MAGTQPVKIVFLLAFLTLSLPSPAATWKVEKGGVVQTIREAVSKAAPYDTILVFPGKYFEKNLVIRKPLVLRGIQKPVLDGEKKYELISIHASHVVIEGFELRRSGSSSMTDYAGIKVVQSNHVTIRNNFLYDMFFGIYFQECRNSTASNNTLKSFGMAELQAGNGIHCWKCDSMTIQRNRITGHRDGIYFEFVTHSTVENNLSEGNIRYGLHFMFSHNNTYFENTFKNNGAGVAVMYTHHVKMLNNTFIDNWGSASYGLLMKDISDSRVERNRFINNTAGIYMEGSSRLEMSENIFENNGCALRIQASCDDNTIENNNFKTNTFDITTNGTLVLNTFRNNYWDKYEGYDLNRDGTGDVPYHPVSLYSMIIDKIPVAVIFLRSFMVSLMDKTEKALPGITPENFIDVSPKMKPLAL